MAIYCMKEDVQRYRNRVLKRSAGNKRDTHGRQSVPKFERSGNEDGSTEKKVDSRAPYAWAIQLGSFDQLGYL